MAPIEDRAVLECFYGRLWTPSERAAVMRRVAAHRPTAYVYGPAGDPRTGERWRAPYASDGEALEQLVADAHGLGMTATWRVSPGAPVNRAGAMILDSDDELATLLARIDDVAALGFDRVLIAFDDLDPELPPSTVARFGHDPHPIAAAQSHVLNACFDHARTRGLRMLACPTHYWGLKPSRYRQRLAELLDADLVLCWTGDAVTATRISAAQAREAERQYRHPVWLWDNFPVNDWAGYAASFSNECDPRRMPLAPLRERDSELAEVLRGYGANAAVGALTGVPALCTALDWAADPEGYDADASLRNALDEMGAAPGALATLADLAGTTPVGGTPGRLARAIATHVLDRNEATTDAVRAELERALAAARGAYGSLGPEFDAWLDAVVDQVSGGIAALDVMAHHGSDPESLREALYRMRDAVRAWSDRSVADGLITSLVDRAEGLGGAGAPPWPDLAVTDPAHR